jgi:isoleucyl-tRNA synthetase
MERHGADAVRLFLVASSQVWVPRRFDENAIRETAGRFLLTFRNVYNGIFAQYANFGWQPSANDPAVADRPALDRWILSRLTRVEQEVNRHLESYDATLAARRVMQFMDDDVSKWYVRQSRARFYDIDSADNRAAFATLHEVLTVTCRLLAPFAPFITDAVHRALTGTSVHLAPYTREQPTPVDDTLETAMDDVRTLAGLAHAARDVADVKVRQPLPSLQCVVPGNVTAVSELGALLASELNVKRVEFVTSTDALVSLEAKANFRTLGKKFGKETPLVAEAVAALGSEQLDGLRLQRPAAARAQVDVLGPHPQDAAGRHTRCGLEQVHWGRADEAGHKGARRPAVDLLGRVELLHSSVVHDDHALGHRHGLDLVVGDEQAGDAQLGV